MRRWITTMAVMMTVPAVVAGLGATANAQVAPANPIDALKRQLVENRGVKMSKVLTDTMGGKKVNIWTEGVAEFGKGKIMATDMTYRSDFKYFAGPVRQITFEGRTYAQEGAVPKGKSWFLYEDKKTRPVLDVDWIKLADPVMLKAVLATTRVKRPAGVYDGTHTTLYQGTITLGQLYKASPGFPFGLEKKPTRNEAEAKISWRLWLGEDQLVRRAWGSWGEPYSKSGDVRHSYVVDARLTGWGVKTDIVPPPAEDVTTSGDLAMDRG
jgi:hypothetical protein